MPPLPSPTDARACTLALALFSLGGCDLAVPAPFKTGATPLFDPKPPAVDAPDDEPLPDDGPPDELGCADLFLASAVGDGVSAGSTFGTGDDHAYCAEEGDTGWGYRAGPGDDVIFYWVAPSEGTYTFDTRGSTFDTMLTLYSGDCGTGPVACNDDYYGLQSEVTARFSSREVVKIALDGFSEGETGDYVLNIREGSGGGGDTGWWGGDTAWASPSDEPAAPPSACAEGAPRSPRLGGDRTATLKAGRAWLGPKDSRPIGVLLRSDPARGGDGACFGFGQPLGGFAKTACTAL